MSGDGVKTPRNRRARSQRNKIVTGLGAALTGIVPVVEAVERVAPGTVPPGTSLILGTAGTALLTFINVVWPK